MSKKNKLGATTFCKLLDEFSEEAAKQTLDDVNEGRCSADTLEKYLYTDETKDEYSARLKKEYEDFE